MSTASERTLIMIPTYNERRNVGPLLAQILEQGTDFDVLFVDDNSPDGTGELLDDLAKEHAPRIHVLHRAGRQGVGSAHQAGIHWAYSEGYRNLITMDSDFAHPPSYLPALRAAAAGYDVVVGSRYLKEDSLDDWTPFRKILTRVGHFLTVTLLRMPYDATGAFRYYRLSTVPAGAFELVRSTGYSFFFESLYILNANGFRIAQIPIHVLNRTAGESKMRTRDVATSVRFLLTLCAEKYLRPARHRVSAPAHD
ncbi:polyprenol monophosphomannose synthase [Nocardia arthritidis]|uniref:Glycosyltransferase n=1 Tax=Nocardia arthritidis TaxID=228602 RepID=A0A6G9YHD9_9NOCA|nr:polyprenol monophosphomannose synthase [Nocardia arthritidis]QIS12373.1 glycosyltransferase [Nocardia arthritidis]